ncbi:MAG: zf-TFIIB domain-containing protein, partial [Candidatus Gastranaerophilales bacterium]|nr:zf-TFIIB domain-containing protein [Candidatus Gastranaerophilales bacterium]
MTDNVDIIINCPACGKEMKKVFLPEQGINLDVCLYGCGGIYFDNREFLKVDEPHEDITPLIEIFEGKTFKYVDQSQIRICPICGTNMVKNFASARHEVEVDECYNCGGKFLDCGELEKIRAQYNTEKERVADVIKELYYSAGEELKDFEQKSESVKENPKSNLYREIKIKT